MNPQCIECECGCWNIVVKVVPPEEPCPYCGNTEPHESCPEKEKALNPPAPETAPEEGETQCKTEEPEKKGKYNVFQFERCGDCGKMHLASGVCPKRGVVPAKRFVCGAHQAGDKGKSCSKGAQIAAAHAPANQACQPRGRGGWECRPPHAKAAVSPRQPGARGSGKGSGGCPSRKPGFTTTYCAANN